MKSLAHQFLDFCRTKPAEEEYDFGSTHNCAFCQFLRDTGNARRPTVYYWEWRDGGQAHALPPILSGAGEESIFAADLGVSVIGAKPHTFGALSSRLSTALERVI